MSADQAAVIGRDAAPAWRLRILDSSIVLKGAAGLVILGAWEGVTRAFAPAYVANPSGIIKVFPAVISDPVFLGYAFSTLRTVAAGMLIAVVLGTVLGLLMGRFRYIRYGLSHYVNSLFTMPMIAVLPLLSLWFGHTPAAALALVSLVAFLSVVINVADGARDVPAEYLEVAKSLRVGRIRVLFDIVLPSAIPYLIAGIRLAGGRALTSAVIADFFLALPGLGYYILYHSRSFHHNEAFVAVIVLVACGVGFDSFVGWVSRTMLPWLRRG